jgi:hypothetical protein
VGHVGDRRLGLGTRGADQVGGTREAVLSTSMSATAAPARANRTALARPISDAAR